LGSPLVQQTVVVDGALNGMPASDDVKTTRRRETIFGPDVGDDDQPGWANPDEGNEVSVDTVKRWVEKAKSEEVRNQICPGCLVCMSAVRLCESSAALVCGSSVVAGWLHIVVYAERSSNRDPFAAVLFFCLTVIEYFTNIAGSSRNDNAPGSGQPQASYTPSPAPRRQCSRGRGYGFLGHFVLAPVVHAPRFTAPPSQVQL
jgi:hypothetical protein